LARKRKIAVKMIVRFMVLRINLLHVVSEFSLRYVPDDKIRTFFIFNTV